MKKNIWINLLNWCHVCMCKSNIKELCLQVVIFHVEASQPKQDMKTDFGLA